MLAATPALTTFLNSTTQGISIPVLTITFADGTVVRWARSPTDVTFSTVTWAAHGQGGRPLIKSYRFRTPLGFEEIGTCEIVLDCGETAVLGGKRLPLAARDGAFQDATVLLERLYKAQPTDAIVGKLFRFQGRVVQAPTDSHSVTLSVESPAARLKSTVLPKTILSPSCGNALYDVACGVSKAANTTSGVTTLAGCTRNVLLVSGGPYVDGRWDLGSAALGSPVTDRVGVRTSVGNQIFLAYPLPAAPAAGVPIALTLGCDHTAGPGGCAKFSNLPRFRAAPHLPREA